LPAWPSCPDADPINLDTGGIEAADAWPMAESYYGVLGAIGTVEQWVSDWYGASYYSSPGSLVDPTGPSSGTDHIAKGNSRMSSHERLRIGTRLWGNSPVSIIRCARTAE